MTTAEISQPAATTANNAITVRIMAPSRPAPKRNPSRREWPNVLGHANLPKMDAQSKRREDPAAPVSASGRRWARVVLCLAGW